MTEDISNDNELARAAADARAPDAHGQAAMLLVESLLHGLVARSVLSVTDAVEIVDIAGEVKIEVAADLGDTPSSLHRSLVILAAIGASLKNGAPNL